MSHAQTKLLPFATWETYAFRLYEDDGTAIFQALQIHPHSSHPPVPVFLLEGSASSTIKKMKNSKNRSYFAPCPEGDDPARTVSQPKSILGLIVYVFREKLRRVNGVLLHLAALHAHPILPNSEATIAHIIIRTLAPTPEHDGQHTSLSTIRRAGGGGKGGRVTMPTHTTRSKKARCRETKHRLHMARSTPHHGTFSYLVKTQPGRPVLFTHISNWAISAKPHYLETGLPQEIMLQYLELQTALHSIPALARSHRFLSLVTRGHHTFHTLGATPGPRLPTPCRL